MRARGALGIILLISVFTVYLQYDAQPADAAYPSTTNVSNTAGKSDRAQIAVSGNNVYVVWQDNTPGNSDIFFARSMDNGATFNTAMNLSNNTGDSGFPRLAVSSSNVYVVWYDYTPGNSDIFFARSIDNGATFSTAINLSNNTGASYNPWVAASGSNVYVVWNDGTIGISQELATETEGSFDVIVGDSEIFFARSMDNGATFDLANVSNSIEAFSWNARMIVSGSNVYLAWNERVGLSKSELFFARSTDAGTSFNQPVNVSRSDEESADAQIAVSGDNAYVIWNESKDGESQIHLARSVDHGVSFEQPLNLSSSEGSSVIGRDGQIVASGSNLYVVWNESDEKGKDVYFARSVDYGYTFEVANLSNSNGLSDYGQVVTAGSDLYVVWQDDTLGNSEVFMKRSVDKGLNFDSTINISDSDAQSLLFILGPQVAVAADTVYIVWEDEFEADDLFLNRFQFGEQLPTLAMLTDDGSARVDFSIDRERLEAGQPAQLTMKFIDPVTGDLIRDINYALMVIGKDGERIMEKNLHANDGMDMQELKFSNAGSFRLVIDVAGKNTGGGQYDPEPDVARLTLIVVPTFPLGMIAIIAALLSGAVVVGLWKRLSRA